MNWISSIKDKSTRLVSNFSRSAQIEETVESLNNTSGLKTTGKPHRIELKDNSNKLEFEDTQRDYMTLMEVLRPLMKRVIYIDKLEDAVELVLSNPAKYLRQDPTELTLPSREDFSNFNVFYEKNKPNEAFLTKILTFEPTLPQLFATDDHIGHEKKESMLRFLMRFVYVVIYFLENAEKERSKQSSSISNKENEVIAVPDKVGHRKESDDIDHDELFDGK